MRFFLTGFMGCGKTFWCKKLAQALNLNFIDLDKYIESKEDEKIATIFETKGETYFRLIEHQALKEIIETNSTCIVSCGGGTPCFHNNMDIMNKHGITIYLQASSEYLLHRLNLEKDKRPLISNLKDVQIQEFIENTLQQREKYYQLATHSIDIENATIHHLKKILNQYV